MRPAETDPDQQCAFCHAITQANPKSYVDGAQLQIPELAVRFAAFTYQCGKCGTTWTDNPWFEYEPDSLPHRYGHRSSAGLEDGSPLVVIKPRANKLCNMLPRKNYSDFF